jgi:hypothetical protein
MGALKRSVLAALALLGSGAMAASAADDEIGPRYFAVCTGRLSAQLAHEWLVQSDRAAETEQHRAHLLDILAAVSTPDAEIQLMAARIDAKAAHAALLRRATFGSDSEDRAWATRIADQHLRSCTALLLS